MSIANYLTALDAQREQLARNLTAMGVSASESEKLNTLVPKVLQIPQTKQDITLFRASINTLQDYGEKIYTFYNDGYRSLNGFSESYPNFCSEENDYALFYNQADFNWGAVIYTMCTESVRITPTKSLLISYRSGASDAGEMWLIPKSSQAMQPSETARFIYEEIQKGNAITVPFNWLQSADNYTSVLLPCEGIASGDYYLAWKAVTDNTHPYIRNIKVLEVS